LFQNELLRCTILNKKLFPIELEQKSQQRRRTSFTVNHSRDPVLIRLDTAQYNDS